MSTWIVVEDEPDLYKVVLILYKLMGVQSAGFASGEETASWIADVDNGRYEGELPRLALVDIRLPGEIDGVDVGARLRESPALRNMAIVLMTGFYMTPEQEQSALERSGADMLLRKPLPNPITFQALLDEKLGQRRMIYG
ncbi:MAG: response regulator [Anaerolineaceae bacterium]|nr:response regulator [Anaerolineaceae bacterium]